MIRPGRRAFMTTLLAGAAALASRQSPELEARKKKKKKAKEKETICPPPPTVDTCPVRTCCKCSNASPTPGCRIGRDIQPGENTADVCDELCGLNLWDYRIGRGSFTEGQSVGCLATSECAVLACPLL